MSEREALYRNVVENRDDDAPRLVYADWLQENGDEPRAEFIRLQCRLAGMTPGDEGYFELRQRERELWSAYGHHWGGKVPHASRHGMPFARGFLDRFTPPMGVLGLDLCLEVMPGSDYCPGQQQLLSSDCSVFTSPNFADVRRVSLNGLFVAASLPLASALRESPYSKGLVGLDFDSSVLRLTDSDLAVLTEPEALPNLRELVFPPASGFSPRGMSSILDAPWADHLKTFGFVRGDLKDGTAESLPSGSLPGVHTLRLQPGLTYPAGPVIRRNAFPGLRAIDSTAVWDSPGLTALINGYPALRELRLDGCDFRRGCADALAGPGMAKLRSLTLRYSRLLAAEVARIAASPHLSSLLELDLSGNSLTRTALLALSGSDHLRGLMCLRLASRFWRRPTPPHVLEFLQRLELPNLRTLDLSHLPVGTAGARYIAESDKFAGLRELYLANCQIGNEGTEALVGSSCLTRLMALSVGGDATEGLSGLTDERNLPALRCCHGFSRDVTSAEVRRALKARYESRRLPDGAK